MNQKKLSKTFMMISNLKKHLVAMFLKINPALSGLGAYQMTEYSSIMNYK